jgi:ribonucleoside-diphosphate reductase alpha chain
VVTAERERPEEVFGITRRVTTGCGKLFVTMNSKDGKLFEVFLALGKSGGCAACGCEAIGRLVSLSLRTGAEIDSVIKHLIGLSCSAPAGFGSTKILSCADAVAKSLQWYVAQKGEGVNLYDSKGKT